MTYTYKCNKCGEEQTVTGGAGVIYKTHGFTKRVRLGRSEG